MSIHRPISDWLTAFGDWLAGDETFDMLEAGYVMEDLVRHFLEKRSPYCPRCGRDKEEQAAMCDECREDTYR